MSDRTVDCQQQHSIDESDWPFNVPLNTGVVTTKNIMERNYPVMEVLRDEEGDWLVLCGKTRETSEGMLVCFGCAYDKNPVIGQFADLDLGYEACRKSDESDWVISKITWDHD